MKIRCTFNHDQTPFQQIAECLYLSQKIRTMENFELKLDFSSCDYFFPCTYLILSHEFKRYKKKNGKEIGIVFPAQGYVASEFYAVGISSGEGFRPYGENYTPLSHFSTKEELSEKISPVFRGLNKIVPSVFGEAPSYFLGELSDNIEQHSEFSHASIMAKYNPQGRFLDMGFLDNGLTIPGSLRKHGHLYNDDDCTAILKVISGFSTKAEREDNRGWGLNTTKNMILGELCGKLQIISGKGALLFNPKRGPLKNNFIGTPLKGTMVFLRIFRPRKKFDIHKYTETRF